MSSDVTSDRDGGGELADEQAALRRLATLVERGAPAPRIFDAIAEEVGLRLGVDAVAIHRFEPEAEAVVVGSWGRLCDPTPVDHRFKLDGDSGTALVYRTGRPARFGDYGHAPGSIGAEARSLGRGFGVASPIVVNEHLWGSMVAGALRAEALPADAEARIAEFTELLVTAISNVQARAEVERLAEEQAALRRVATLVARGVSPEDLFSAVSDEVGRLFGCEAAIARFEVDGSALVAVGLTQGIHVASIGARMEFEDFLASTAVYRTGRPARIDHAALHTSSGPLAAAFRELPFISTVAAPIVVQGDRWGAMAIMDTRKPLPPDAEQRIEKFTELVGTAIANAESRAELAAAEAHALGLANEQTALRRVATLVAEGASAEDLFAAVAHEVAGVIGAPVVSMQRYEDDGTFTVVGVTGETSFAPGSRWPAEDEALAAMILATGRPARKEDYSRTPGPLGVAMREDELVSAVGVPILVNGDIWGLVIAAGRLGSPIPAGTEERLARFTELVATAIANTQANQHLARLADEQAALRRVATLVARGARPADVFSAVSEEVGRLFGSEQAAVARFEPDGAGIVVLGVSEGLNVFPVGTRCELEGFFASTAVYRTGRAARAERGGYENASGPIADRLREIGAVSSVAAPIIVEGDLWGVITVTDTHEHLPPDAESRLEKFTELVATAIANAASRAELAASEARAHHLAREQAALRRVATLIAQAATADEVFSAVAQEVARVFDVHLVVMCRYEADAISVLSSIGAPTFPVGSRWSLDIPSLPASIHHTGGPVRIDDLTDASGIDAIAHAAGVRAAVGVPIVVDGRVWGSINVASTEDEPFPTDAEERLSRFTELVATSVSNATMRAELAASRARLVAAADEERRCVVRDLHDGAQQRLVQTVITLKLAGRALDQGRDDAGDLVAEALRQAETANAELRELAHGILPSILTDGGLQAAVTAVASRMPIPVEIDIRVERLPGAVEATAYFVIAEALTNVAKHAHAQCAAVNARLQGGSLRVEVRDDGIGGTRAEGPGLVGLSDRLAALNGRLRVESSAAGGTVVAALVPLR